ncbi:MAG: hypothetical protein CMK59_06655 [Proteobacteria bacterium]|nr:hypothetical protein [Pseudomonadota bacterium]
MRSSFNSRISIFGLLALFTSSCVAQDEVILKEADALVFVDLMEPDMAGIWNGLVPLDERGFGFSTMSIVDHSEPMQLNIRHYNWDLSQREINGDSFIPVTEQDDLPHGDHITDHAIIRFGEALYFLYTGNVQNYLHLVKTDLNGVREDFRIVYEEAPMPANDMLMVKTEEDICFRIGTDGHTKWVQCFDPDTLDVVFETVIETPRATGNLASAVYHDGEFKVFAGGFDQRDLACTRFDSEWNLQDPFEFMLVESENREWNWAASGSAHLPEYDMWAVAYTNMPAQGQADFDSRGRLDLFDADWNLIDRAEFGVVATHRPHLLWQDPNLILSYDSGPVVIRKYTLE